MAAVVNGGALQVETAKVTILSLTNANNEPWDPTANTSLDDPTAVEVVGGTQAGTYVYQWDHAEQAVYVTNHGGTDPGAGTDVGTVKLRVEGRR